LPPPLQVSSGHLYEFFRRISVVLLFQPTPYAVYMTPSIMTSCRHSLTVPASCPFPEPNLLWGAPRASTPGRFCSSPFPGVISLLCIHSCLLAQSWGHSPRITSYVVHPAAFESMEDNSAFLACTPPSHSGFQTPFLWCLSHSPQYPSFPHILFALFQTPGTPQILFLPHLFLFWCQGRVGRHLDYVFFFTWAMSRTSL